MMRIRRLRLKNFQAHRLLEVTLARITTLQGRTDVGKSAIYRALKWVCLNGPSRGFIREGSGEVKVVLDFSVLKTRHRVKRVRGRSNAYFLDGKKYVAFQGQPPDSVVRALGLCELNFQGQFDPPFWFGETAGEVSRQLNAVVDLKIIDRSMANANALVRRHQEQVNVSRQRLQQRKAEYEQLRKQRERVRDFHELRDTSRVLARLKSHTGQLEQLVASLHTHQGYLRAYTRKADDTDRICRLALEANRPAQAARQLAELLEDLRASKRAATLVPPPLGVLEDAHAECQRRREVVGYLSVMVAGLKGLLKESHFAQCRLDTAKKEFVRQTKGQRCPLCLAPLP